MEIRDSKFARDMMAQKLMSENKDNPFNSRFFQPSDAMAAPTRQGFSNLLSKMEQRDKQGTDVFPALAMASGFAPSAGISDVLGFAPDPFNPGQTLPSFSENIDKGKYLDAGLQTVGAGGDVMLAASPFMPLLLAPAAAMKMTSQIGKALRSGSKATKSVDDIKDKVIVQHNINETALLQSDKIGGLPVPSLAISKADNPLTGFGDVTLIGDPNMAKPSGGNPVFRADGYTTRRPKADIFVNNEAENFAENNVTNVFADIPRGSSVSQLDGASVNQTIAEDLFKGFEGSYSNIPLRAKYMIDKGLLDPKKFETQVDIARFVRTDFKETEDYYNYIGKLRKDMLASGGDATEKLFVTYTNTGRKYLPATLDNYVKLMKKNKGAGQENLMLTMGALRAKVTPKFRNISQIKAERSKIVNNEDFVKAKDMVEQDYTDFMDQLTDVLPKDIDFRTAEELFNDIVTNRLGSHPYSKPYEPKITEAILKQGAELRQKLINLPTEYFEIKPQRGVKINEFKGAIVPENALKSTLEILKKNGITKIFKYKNEDERKKLVSKFPEFMFSAGGLAVGVSAMQRGSGTEGDILPPGNT